MLEVNLPSVRLVVLVGLISGLAGCDQSQSHDLMSAVTVGDPQLKQSVPYRKLVLMSDVDTVAQLKLANTIAEKCPQVAPNPKIGPLLRPVINRVAVFQGREKLAAAVDGNRRALEAKYGLSLDQSSDLCPVAKREIAEQGPLAAFWLNKGL
ncbi:hypothetical protein [Paracoccus sp. (in: a-proteobacteria)]|uniref:hypothetical protein n=1 Tax=Paracoccus sp. TaxID=267 RepID=UPI003A899781